jgi:hypothetical protein
MAYTRHDWEKDQAAEFAEHVASLRCEGTGEVLLHDDNHRGQCGDDCGEWITCWGCVDCQG